MGQFRNVVRFGRWKYQRLTAQTRERRRIPEGVKPDRESLISMGICQEDPDPASDLPWHTYSNYICIYINN